MTGPASAARACALCGLPSAPAAASDPGPVYCCPGCRAVAEMLASRPGGPPPDPRATELYRASAAAGLIPGAAGPAGAPVPAQEGGGPGAEVTFRVEGMWCPSCAWWVEAMLRRLEGVLDARVSFASDLATVRHLPQRVGPRELLERTRALGYGASRLEDPPDLVRAQRERNRRLGVSLLLTGHLMMISMALYGGFFSDLGPTGVLALSLPQWALATVVVFYGGLPILRRAGEASMDTLIAAGSLSAYGYSVAALAAGSLHLYFDTAAALVALSLLGRSLEGRAREAVARDARDLRRWAAGKARVRTGGTERWAAAAELSPGQKVRVAVGERIPADGSVLWGRGRVDGSSLTGEARPQDRGPGDEVWGGTVLVEGELGVRVALSAAGSAAGRMAELTEEALSRKGALELTAEQAARWLVPAVLILAGGTALVLLLRGAGAEAALLRGLTVLVVTCPCALGLAVPLAKVAAVGGGRRRGILVRNPAALERVASLDVLVLDKTGTLTEGRFELRDVATEGATEADALERAAAVEGGSRHFLGRALVRRAREAGLPLEEPAGFEEVPGAGVSGVVRGVPVAVGTPRHLGARGLVLSATLERRFREFEAAGLTTVLAGWDGKARALFAFGDALKPGAARLVDELRRRGLSLWLVSGDSEGATGAAARALGIERYQGRALPEDKAALVRGLAQGGHRVGMVGDGVNDAPALAEARVGFALGAGAGFLSASADVVLLSAAPEAILDALDHGALASRAVRQNLLFAFAYNALAIPAALAGHLNPLVAALAMVGSSLTVVGNSLRVARYRGRAPAPDLGSPA